MVVIQVEVSELCELNPELVDHINNANAAADAPRPVPDKASVILRHC